MKRMGTYRCAHTDDRCFLLCMKTMSFACGNVDLRKYAVYTVYSVQCCCSYQQYVIAQPVRTIREWRSTIVRNKMLMIEMRVEKIQSALHVWILPGFKHGSAETVPHKWKIMCESCWTSCEKITMWKLLSCHSYQLSKNWMMTRRTGKVW